MGQRGHGCMIMLGFMQTLLDDLILEAQACPHPFLDIAVAFALFRRSAINLLIIVSILHNTAFPPICRAQAHYRLCALTR